MTLKPRTINYRKVEFEPSGGDHLQNLLKRRLATPGVVVDMSLTNAADSPHHVLSTFQSRRGAACGELLRFERGRDVPLVDVDARTGTVWTGAAPPVDSNGTRRHFAESSLYFGLRENHLAVIQSAGLGLQELQSYFGWLLNVAVTAGGGGGSLPPRPFFFRNVPSKGAKAAIQGNQVRGIAIGSSLFHESKIPVTKEANGKKRTVNRSEYKIDASTKGILKEVMRVIGANDTILDDFDRHADPGSIRVNLEVTYLSRGDKEGQELMHAIAGALDDGDFPKASIRLKGGREIKGEELTIRDSVKVQTINGNIVVDDALKCVSSWLIDSIKNGIIV
jgi:hypothetical protein